jgi:hypothetical protein
MRTTNPLSLGPCGDSAKLAARDESCGQEDSDDDDEKRDTQRIQRPKGFTSTFDSIRTGDGISWKLEKAEEQVRKFIIGISDSAPRAAKLKRHIAIKVSKGVLNDIIDAAVYSCEHKPTPLEACKAPVYRLFPESWRATSVWPDRSKCAKSRATKMRKVPSNEVSCTSGSFFNHFFLLFFYWPDRSRYEQRSLFLFPLTHPVRLAVIMVAESEPWRFFFSIVVLFSWHKP